MLCAEKARQCSSCSATAQLNIAPLVSNRPEILQSAAAIILTLLIQFVSATHRSVPELLRQHSYTVHDLVSCLSVISTEDGRFMSSVNVIAEALLRHKKGLTTLTT